MDTQTNQVQDGNSSLVPLGGYVKMYGDADAASSKKNKKVKEDDKFSFHNKSIAQRSTILFNCPVLQILFFLCLVFLSIVISVSI